jgi:acetoacetyl-CoA synthetase
VKEPLWKPSDEQIAQSNLTQYMQRQGERLGRKFADARELYRWSVEHIDQFWESVWAESGVIQAKPYDSVLSDGSMPGAKWFPGARLNFAENHLRFRDDHTAIMHVREGAKLETITFNELYSRVKACATGLKKLGVQQGDRVAAFIPNIPEAIIAMLATTSIGALWSSCSPDFGLEGVMARFGQITPKVLLTADGYQYNGTQHNSLDRVQDIVERIPEIETLVVVPLLNLDRPELKTKVMLWDELLSDDSGELTFEQLPFDHPVYIMYSSGTTGKPKCIVHGAGGTLLQHWKEHVLHTNLRRDDVIMYFTTCGWMMWNWLVGALQVGVTIVLYDGSPGWPKISALWRLIEQTGMTVFGTSPKYLSACENARYVPKDKHDLTRLRSILSTGAPLTAQNFSYVYQQVKPDIQLASISGGTDIISCFMLGNPNLPVYSEEIQCRGLGMKVETYNEDGRPVLDEVGELVCTAPFVSMPVAFWNDPDGKLYRKAYFEHYPGVWRHGDYIKIHSDTGGVTVYGRSDATLNPGGVRIGTAEIYNPVEALDEVLDSIVIGQRWKGDTRVVLFVVLRDGTTLDDTLRAKIKDTIRRAASPRHVPSIILQVTDVPHTINGKKVEIAVTKLIHGESIANRDALANPDSLKQFTDFQELKPNHA